MDKDKAPIANSHVEGIEDRRRSPEENLLVAILIRALMDLHSSDRLERRHALRFFLSQSKKEWSFNWICIHLQMDALKLRFLLEQAIEKVGQQNAWQELCKDHMLFVNGRYQKPPSARASGKRLL